MPLSILFNFIYYIVTCMSSRSRSRSRSRSPTSRIDPITREPIPAAQLVKLNRHAFNAHSLANMIHYHTGSNPPTNPLTRQHLTPEQQAVTLEIARRTGWSPDASTTQEQHVFARVPTRLQHSHRMTRDLRRQSLASMHDLIGQYGGTSSQAIAYADKVVKFLERLEKAISKTGHLFSTDKIIGMRVHSVLLRSDVLDHTPGFDTFSITQPGVGRVDVAFDTSSHHAPDTIKLTLGSLVVTLERGGELVSTNVNTPFSYAHHEYIINNVSTLLPGYTLRQSIRTYTPTATETRSTKGTAPLAFIAAVTHVIGMMVHVKVKYRGYVQHVPIMDILRPRDIIQTSSDVSDTASTSSSAGTSSSSGLYSINNFQNDWKHILRSVETMLNTIGKALHRAPSSSPFVAVVQIASLQHRPPGWVVYHRPIHQGMIGQDQTETFRISGIQTPTMGQVYVDFTISMRYIHQVVFTPLVLPMFAFVGLQSVERKQYVYRPSMPPPMPNPPTTQFSFQMWVPFVEAPPPRVMADPMIQALHHVLSLTTLD